MKQILCVVTAIFLLSSCKNTKKTLGLTENIPDELQVTKAKPLEIPPHFNSSKTVKTAIQKPSKDKLTPAEEAVIHEIDKE
jgi:hypothetical protein